MRPLLLTALGLIVLASPLAANAQEPPRPRDDLVLTGVEGERIVVGQGGVTELIFVARWCRPCQAALSDARRRQSRLGRSGYRVVVVGIARREDRGGFVRWANSIGYRRGLVFDADGSLARRFGAGRIPHHVVVGRGGRVLFSDSDAPGPEAIRKWLSN